MAHLAFLIPHLHCGGTEQLTLWLTGAALDRGHAVDLVVLSAEGELRDAIPSGARLIDLECPRIAAAFAPLRRYLRASSPDMIVAAMWPLPVLTVAASVGLKRRPRIIASEHCSLGKQYGGSPHTMLSIRATMRLSYRFADAVVGVSDGVSREVAALAALPHDRVHTVRNPVARPAMSDRAAVWPRVGGKRILAVGRLKRQKNYPLLIEAFALLAQRREVVLAIVGEGEERPALEAMIHTRGLADRIILPGYSATPGDWYTTADLFVVSSDYEGLPLVLVEALHAGLPAISTDCPSGPDEVLQGGRWGRLVPVGDAGALAEAMAAALDDPGPPEPRQAHAATYSVDAALDRYLELGRCA